MQFRNDGIAGMFGVYFMRIYKNLLALQTSYFNQEFLKNACGSVWETVLSRSPVCRYYPLADNTTGPEIRNFCLRSRF